MSNELLTSASRSCEPLKVDDYPIHITDGWDGLGAVFNRVIPAARQVAIVSNRRVYGLYGEAVESILTSEGFHPEVHLIGEGERAKTLTTFGRVVNYLADNYFERTDAVIGLGGGIVTDVTGFAAACYLRGIPYLALPTSLLAQIDASVGAKTGVNLPTGKNLAGAFYPPRAVFINTRTLPTLSRRELTAGWCEAIKHGLISDSDLLERTTRYLTHPQDAQLPDLIRAHCAFKAHIVAGDATEDPARTDAASRRILNFGHTIGHALESVTRFRLKHGEAVGYGMRAAVELSNRLGLLSPADTNTALSAIGLAGRLPKLPPLDPSAVSAAIQHDKKKSRGQVQWVLLQQIGKPRLVDGREISESLLHQVIQNLTST